MSPARSALALSAILVLGLAGCAPAAPGPDPGQPTDDATVLAAEADRLWAQVASRYPDLERPDVTVERTITPAEWGAVIHECVLGEGVPDATLDEAGMVGWEGPTAQEQSFHLAMYICQVRFPQDARYLAALTEEQLGLLFDYYVDTLTPCLEDRGYDVSAPPSRTRFVAEYGQGVWYPYQAVPPTLPPDEWAELTAACPQEPGDALYE